MIERGIEINFRDYFGARSYTEHVTYMYSYTVEVCGQVRHPRHSNSRQQEILEISIRI